MSDCCNCEVDTRALAARQRRVLLAVLAINIVALGQGSRGVFQRPDDLGGCRGRRTANRVAVDASRGADRRDVGVASLLDLAANGICLYLLNPVKVGDVSMSSAWECSRNDVVEGGAVIVTTLAVALFASAWPDIIVAIVLLAMFLRSAIRVLGTAMSTSTSLGAPKNPPARS